MRLRQPYRRSGDCSSPGSGEDASPRARRSFPPGTGDQGATMAKPFKGKIDLDIRDSVPDWDAFLADRAPEGAPNVLVVLFDDTGCAAWSPYGGRIEMPTLQ